MAASFKAYGGERARLAALWKRHGTTPITDTDYRQWVYPFPHLAAEEPSKEETVAVLQKAIADNDTTVLDEAVVRVKQRAEYYSEMMNQLETEAMKLGENHYVQRNAAVIIGKYEGDVFVDITPSCKRGGGGGENINGVTPKWLTYGKGGYNRQLKQIVFLQSERVTERRYPVTTIGAYDTPMLLGHPIEIYIAPDPLVQHSVASRYM
jgi:hypothetical protein